ncbi:amidase [Mongoliibacter ruber]|uniref:Asp-tRNA(Asn)/Glu-tRNA(Gln) amidotransferase A subunit family amidase n=1 Tax=Mongoliibacter ruber TaxID=1750599 RepID=A0A2T0WER5_9BACT|nr:amidase [Mongoliibacter ruber]PRY85145.1 Asp-tRNA(Asn)/Glu-tRNA(Gln) amidotransferase A subunit family amidase [Mongoliibacter ruber]
MKKYGWLLLLAGFALGFVVANSGDKIKRSDVRAALNLFHLDFEKAEIDTMLSYLERNRKGYDEMRAFSLGNDVEPALVFDPFPNDVQFPLQNEPSNWAIPEDVILPEDDEEIAFMSIPELASLLKSGKLSSKRLTTIYLDRIKQYDSKLQSFITVTEELALKQAEKADVEFRDGNYKGILHGIPYGIKDLAAVPEYPTTWGAAPYQNQVIDEKASVVIKLEEAGAVLLGKVVSGSLARGDVWFGGKTKNPWDLNQGATGSSAGAGAATAAGLVAFSIGTETLGSIVSPSTRTGITGLRPTYGAVSKAGFMVLSWSMDKVGPICRSAEDCAIVYDYIRGEDPKDRSSKPTSTELNQFIDIHGLKIGYVEDQFNADTARNNVNNKLTLEELRSMGLNLEAVQLPKDYPFDVFDIILRAESGAFFDELITKEGHREMVEQHKGSRANSLRQSRLIPAVEYLQANRHRRRLIEEVHQIFKDYDVIISPTFGGEQMLITNLTGHPALSVPNGIDNEGHPTSITFLGNYFEEAKMLQLAKAYQQTFAHPKGRPSAYKQ